MRDLAPQTSCCWTDHKDMSLLRSCSTRVARLAINMALLTELLAAPATILRCVKYACKVPPPPYAYQSRSRFCTDITTSCVMATFSAI
jgi:hypothetical protein